MAHRVLTLKFRNNEERHIFRYTRGDEAQLIKTFYKLAEDISSGLDLYDTQVLIDLAKNRRTEDLKQR